ncbi:hypothetical protein CHS0354_000569 [Potamilus streckersoni]|uniref:D-3-phosphoglycerate dehydrogenase n=1 Tax=Potamilus streckersoni TaxID=2493646 RepID=A0AAE0W819_9BIVA|nr:hypothetical protein CHS0354_000569 [Potamilus streckersoni]
MRALILDNIEVFCGEILRKSGIEVKQENKLSRDGLKEVISNYEIVIVRSATKIDAEIIELGKKLRLIGRAGVGVDNIDIEAATNKSILVMNTPGGNTVSAAEHTCGMLLSVARLIPQAHAETAAGIWDRKKWMGVELEGKTLAILGFGKIGQEVARRMTSFGMRILVYDPMIPDEFAQTIGVNLSSLEKCFQEADFITLHTPLNSSTRGLVSKKTIEMMKTGVRIVNCARGGIVNEADLAEELTKGKVAAAAADVFEKEPLSQDSPLLKAPHFIMTPHIAASTIEAQSKVATQIALQIGDWISGKEVVGVVNAASLGLVQNLELQAYIELSEKMGSFVAQYVDGQPKQLTVFLSGSMLGKFSDHIISAVLKGIFKIMGEKNIRHNTALAFAKSKGIVIEVNREKSHQDYTDLVRIEYSTELGKSFVSGFVIGKTAQRINMIDEFTCEVKLEKYLLVYKNRDKPGVIARVGARLLRVNKNIANVSLSRNEEKTKALTIISLDSDVDDDVLERIKNVDDDKLLKKRYYDINKKSHPDFFIHNSPNERRESLLFTADLNVAFKTLKDKITRFYYVSELLLGDSVTELKKIDSLMLMQMMQVQEKVDEFIRGNVLRQEVEVEKKNIMEQRVQVERNMDSLSIEFDTVSSIDERIKIIEAIYKQLVMHKYFGSLLESITKALHSNEK